jgi:membrane-associated phospholipid phosphatase
VRAALIALVAISGVVHAADPSAGDLRALPHNILSDQKRIWTSPFHMNRSSAKRWVVMGAATAALIATDRHTVNAFENAPTQTRWANNISRVGSAYTVVPVAAGFFLTGVAIDDPKARATGVLGAEALLDGLIVQEVLKPIAGRDRPYMAHDHPKWFDGGASFPSGHAIAAWSLASVISRQYPHHKWVPLLTYGLAATVSAARFTAQQHYLSDVVAGGAIGWFIGHYVVRAHRRATQ